MPFWLAVLIAFLAGILVALAGVYAYTVKNWPRP